MKILRVYDIGPQFIKNRPHTPSLEGVVDQLTERTGRPLSLVRITGKNLVDLEAPFRKLIIHLLGENEVDVEVRLSR